MLFEKMWFEQGFETGCKLGLEKGLREILLTLLKDRCGSLSQKALQRLQALPAEGLRTTLRLAFRGASLKDLGLED